MSDAKNHKNSFVNVKYILEHKSPYKNTS